MSVWSIYNKTSIFSYDIKSLKNVSIYINVYEHVNILIKYTYKTHTNIHIYTYIPTHETFMEKFLDRYIRT